MLCESCGRTHKKSHRVQQREQMKNLLTVAETAEALNLKISTVRAWLAKRKLPRVNCGRAVRIPAVSIAEFIDRNTIPARESRQ
jgi:excisionase family DNA binding protein